MKRFKKKTALKVVGRAKRHLRTRDKIFGKQDRPRVVIFRSQKNIYAQVVDDTAQKVLFQVSSLGKDLKLKKGTTIEAANHVGEALAKKALAQKINKIVFDVNGYKYHGRIKALAEAARKGGLQF